jgi:signal transduction histidine kinase
LNSILSALPSGLIVYDRDGGIIRMNELARGMLVYDDETWKRPVSERVTNVVQLSRPDGTPLAWDEYPAIRALRGEEVRNEDLFMHLPAHPEIDRWTVLSACPMQSPGGERMGAVITMTDVTDLHEARARLQDANEVLQRQADELREAKEGLEQRVQARTAELAVLLEEVEANRAQLRALSRRLVEMQENERSFVADQLYNQAAQVLSAVRMQLWALEKHQGEAASPEFLAGIKNALDQTILALHDLATQLRPAGLARATLAGVLRDYVAQIAAAHGIVFRFDGGGTEGLRIPVDVVTAVFRAVQEALANVTRHSQAGEVSLSLSHDGERLVVILADDGIGFVPADASEKAGVGLISMRERIASAGGRLEISSSSGGTQVRIEVPVPQLS